MKKVIKLFLLMFIVVNTSSIFAKSYQSEILSAANKKANGDYVRKQFVSLMGKTFDASAKKKLLVIGDSHAQDFINMAFEGGHLNNYQVKTRHIPTGCQVILTDDYEKYIDKKSKALCKKSDSVKQALEQIKNADIIILVANWKEWSAKELPNTINNLKLSSKQKLIVVGRKSFGKVKLRKLVRKSKKDLIVLQNTVDSQQLAINKIMEKNLDKAIYVDFQKIICQQKNKCLIFTPDVKLITFDGGHLTKAGVKFLGDKLFAQSPLKEL